ncbi:unnamed protein product [Ectocarpus sp. CCAP 1310/34]|nr:unnamed protein product [Ectocarpus sp. CCAP 1310/34]
MLPTAGGGGPNAANAAELSFEVDFSPARLLLRPTADGGTLRFSFRIGEAGERAMRAAVDECLSIPHVIT